MAEAQTGRRLDIPGIGRLRIPGDCLWEIHRHAVAVLVADTQVPHGEGDPRVCGYLQQSDAFAGVPLYPNPEQVTPAEVRGPKLTAVAVGPSQPHLGRP